MAYGHPFTNKRLRLAASHVHLAAILNVRAGADHDAAFVPAEGCVGPYVYILGQFDLADNDRCWMHKGGVVHLWADPIKRLQCHFFTLPPCVSARSHYVFRVLRP